MPTSLHPDRVNPEHLAALTDTASCLFHGGLKGLEREALRVDRHGQLSLKPHPLSLGSTLTHPYITTDYSEALLEFITPPHQTAGETLEFLLDVQKFAYARLEDEILWATSMPCALGKDSDIPIAEYGHSNVGQMKHVYRRGLGFRYGRKMQTIAGVHFNYSLPESFWPVWRNILGTACDEQQLRSHSYFNLIRNFQRIGWLIPLLFGASPAVCKSFLGGNSGKFQEFDRHTAFLPYATSLRMSDIGYKNKAQEALSISYNDLDSYVQGLWQAIETPWDEYAKIGVKKNGEYLQLNDHLLQIENEYYSFIRPKNVAQSGEKPTMALKRRGVAYIEVRAIDNSAFDPAGVNLDQLRFIEILLIYCMLLDSPKMDKDEQLIVNRNQSLIATQGRDPELLLRKNGGEIRATDWARQIMAAMEDVAILMDRCEINTPYQAALKAQAIMIENLDNTPSARILQEMRDQQLSFLEFAYRKSLEHQRWHQQRSLDKEREKHFEAESGASLERQQQIEANDTLSFDQYLAQYFSQAL